MIIDGRTLSLNESIETDLCIIGSGPAGLTLAHELIGTGLRICILESGGLNKDEFAQNLNKGRLNADYYDLPLHLSRQRQAGGTANVWGTELGRNEMGTMYAPLDPIDFEKRSWIPHSGWPIKYHDLVTYFERAQHVCGCGGFLYRAEDWEADDSQRLRLNPQKISNSVYQFGLRMVFTETLLGAVKKSENIRLITHATTLSLEADENAKSVNRAFVAATQDRRFTVKARRFVLAGGGIENARLLLLSNAVQKEGLGNEHDVVGRYFMDHPIVRTGTIYPTSRNIFNHLSFYDLKPLNGRKVMGKLTPTERLLRKKALLNISTFLFPRSAWHGSKAASYSFRAILEAAKRTRLPASVGKHFSRVLFNAHDVAFTAIRKVFNLQPPIPSIGRGGWSDCDKKEKRFARIEVVHATEQAPDPENRITFDSTRDQYGQPRAKLTWKWREDDVRSILQFQEILQQEIQKAGVGSLKIERDGGLPQLLGASKHHHMGTTRMSDDPRRGVVDENAKVHSLKNLFIAGSSIFPTGGYANPTLTIIALTIKLADHLKRQTSS